VLEGTYGCGIAGSGTTRGKFDIPRAPNQDLGLKESCHKAQDGKVLQNSMEQPYHRRSCRSGFTTLPPTPLLEQPAEVC
jgi:hypothetical protein